MSLIEVKVPDIGDFKEVEVIEILVKPGDSIQPEQSLVTVESDKASMEIPSSTAGVVKEIRIKLGDKVAEGSVILLVEAGASAQPEVIETRPTTTAVTPSPSASAPVASTVEIRVPDIGDFKDVEIIEVLVKQGDVIKVEQSLMTVESDKASMEIPSSSAGVIKELRVKLGDRVNKGDVIALLESTGAASAPVLAATPPAAPAAMTSAPPLTPSLAGTAPVNTTAKSATSTAALTPTTPPGQQPHASPSVRKFARELGVDLLRVTPTGPKGRITPTDVQNFVKAVLSNTPTTAATPGKSAAGGAGFNVLPWPSIDFSKFGPTTLEPLSRIKKLSGPNLHRNWVTMPHVTQFDEADITDLEQFRQDTNAALSKQGVKVTMLAFVMKASFFALKKFPAFNSSLDDKGENLILKQYYHLGFAADTPNGLVVPVVKDCDKKGVAQLAAETAELAKKARDGKLSPNDMSGATFTISSLGGVGGTAFTPIINAPEVAILGLSKSEFKPKWDGKQFVPKLMLPMSLSYDHRVIDGAMAAKFTTYLADVLSDLRKVLV